MKGYSQKELKDIIPNKHVLDLKRKVPTIDWKKRMVEGDKLFTEKLIVLSESILIEYLDNISLPANKGNNKKQLSSLKKAIKKLNKLNTKSSYIDSMEREELVEFFNEACSLAGLDYVGDITEEYREW